MMTNIRKYSELVELKTFEDRYEYLRLNGSIGVDTFGYDRVFNQMFYRSKEWKNIRDYVIVRDNACDLGISDRPITAFRNKDGRLVGEKIIIHHMNPIMLNDIKHSTDNLLNPEYLITTTLDTHNAIHYGNTDGLRANPVERYENDTCPWKV